MNGNNRFKKTDLQMFPHKKVNSVDVDSVTAFNCINYNYQI